MDHHPHQSSSSEEISNEAQERDITTTTTIKRSYECTFCKRGFTNAQALGGHMNIHRRDRGKAAAKQQQAPPTPTNPPSRNKNPNSSYSREDPVPSSRFNYPVFEAQRVSYPMYFQAPGLNPSSFRSAGMSATQCLVNEATDEGVWGANLSLRTGSADTQVVSMEEDEEELDLELRLGHHP